MRKSERSERPHDVVTIERDGRVWAEVRLKAKEAKTKKGKK